MKDHRVSLSAIRRMFEAPSKGNLASGRYKGLIDAKVGRKQNSYREPHTDAHYLLARNKLRREFAIHQSKDVAMLSVDDMAKIKVETPAVSRYHQIRIIFMNNDSPNLPDHDFPVPGYLLKVSGYMFLESKTQEMSSRNEGLTNASIYDREVDKRDNSKPDFECMKAEGPASSIFDILCRQGELHLIVKMSTKELEETIFEKLSGKFSKAATCSLQIPVPKSQKCKEW